jgi:hypothetical protein
MHFVQGFLTAIALVMAIGYAAAYFGLDDAGDAARKIR